MKPNSASNRPLVNVLQSFLAIFLIAFGMNVSAGEGHDHGEAAAPSAGAPASPRFQAHSDLFEVVGVLGKSELSILIDRYGTNEPVLDARVEVEVNNLKVTAKFHAEHGDYSVPAETLLKPGTYPVTLTITSGKETDLLTGDLVVPDPEAGHSDAGSSTQPWLRWASYAVGGAVALLTLFTLFSMWRRRRVQN
jgi:hypothetical protein